MRNYNFVDKIIVECDKAINTVLAKSQQSSRPVPGNDLEPPQLSDDERKLAIRLMRVNHAGEVSAQALYQGQALTAKLPEVRDAMTQAAQEENDHLAWCEDRVHELGGYTSLLNPFWYVGSYILGAAAGQVGDKWSLGFVAETETQVGKHIDEHIEKIGHNDTKSHAILAQMKIDEAHHGAVAMQAGGVELPPPVKFIMSWASKVMTTTSYRI
tara:strand:+ start:564 stop:1202 length:639 start_codon:yes stop_codon:yes gene_type:complete